MKTRRKIEGFHNRVVIVLNRLHDEGIYLDEVQKRMGTGNHHLYDDNQWGAFKVARFCSATGCSADWLLGLRGGDPFD